MMKIIGFDFYSRNTSVIDELPISYKNKILIPQLNVEIFKKLNIHSFIIDSELVPQSNIIHNMKDGTEVVADTQLSLVTSILGSLDNLSHKIQETNPLKFMVFDCLKFNNLWLNEYSLKVRLHSLDNLYKGLKYAGMR